MTSRTDNDAWGEIVWQSGQSSRKGFIDKEEDKESGLGDFGVRKYDSGLGRFGSIDPLWEKYRNSSPYVYSLNNPLSIIDPTGKSGEAIIDSDNNTITVKAHYIFYGNAASNDNAKKIVEKMQSDWNKAGEECINVKGKEYSVKFEFTYEVLPTRDKALEEASKMALMFSITLLNSQKRLMKAEHPRWVEIQDGGQ